jgi:hypothetical protein
MTWAHVPVGVLPPLLLVPPLLVPPPLLPDAPHWLAQAPPLMFAATRHWPAVLLHDWQVDDIVHFPSHVVSFGWHAQMQL